MGWLGTWIDTWFDETDWPRDPELDDFRDAVWELSLNGEPRGWLTTSISPMRALPFFWDKEERMWSQVHRLDGSHLPLEEDYGPQWHSVKELRAGYFDMYDPLSTDEVDFDAALVTGPERDRLWAVLEHGVEPPD